MHKVLFLLEESICFCIFSQNQFDLKSYHGLLPTCSSMQKDLKTLYYLACSLIHVSPNLLWGSEPWWLKIFPVMSLAEKSLD